MEQGKPPLLRIAFDATLEDRVDAQQRLAMRLPSLRAQRRNSRIAVGILVGLALFFLPEVYPQSSPPSPIVRTGIAVASALFGYWLSGPMLRQSHRRLLQRALRDLGGKDSVHCEIEVHADIVHVQQDGVEMSWPWLDLQSIEVGPRDVALWFRQSALVVRNRAFDSEQQRQQFVELARRLRATASAQ